jgi:copper transport protein
MRRRLVLAAAIAALLVPVPAAFAHAYLIASTPSDGTELHRAPPTLTLRFTEPPDVAFSHVVLVSASGRPTELALASPGAATLVARVPPNLPRGGYTVHWRILGVDGHVTRGVLRFGLNAPIAPLQLEPGQGPGVRADVLRWLYFVSLGVTAGMLLFGALVAEPGLPDDHPLAAAFARRRIALAAAAGAFAALELDLLGYVEWTHEIVGGGWRSFSEAQLQDLRGGTPTGLAWSFTTFGWLAVLALIGLAQIRPQRRRAYLVTAGMLALACGAGLSMSGHAAARDGSLSLSALVDFIHLVSAALWLGGVVALAALVWPVARRLQGEPGRAFVTGVVLRVSAALTVVVAVVAVTGLYLAVRRLHTPGDLTRGYGLVLLVKSLAVALSLAAGAYHRFALVPRLRGGLAPPARPRSLRLESALIASVLLAAAVLTNAAPPR